MSKKKNPMIETMEAIDNGICCKYKFESDLGDGVIQLTLATEHGKSEIDIPTRIYDLNALYRRLDRQKILFERISQYFFGENIKSLRATTFLVVRVLSETTKKELEERLLTAGLTKLE